MKKTNNVGGEQAETTTDTVRASPENDAEFCDCPGAKQRFGLKRSLLYQLHAEELIDGCSLRRKGKQRGKRLSRDGFVDAEVDRLATKELLEHLINQETDAPWAGWWENDLGNGNTRGPAAKLARLLKPYCIMRGGSGLRTVRHPAATCGKILRMFGDATAPQRTKTCNNATARAFYL